MGKENTRGRVDAHGGDGMASTTGVPVDRFDCYVDECSYCISQNVTEQLPHRRKVLESLRIWESKPD